MIDEKTETSGTSSFQQPAQPVGAAPARPSSPAQPVKAAEPEREHIAGQTLPSLASQPGIAPDGSVTDPERVKAAQEERAAYLHGNPPDDHPFSDGRTVGDIRAAQSPQEIDDGRRVIEIDDKASEFSGKVTHATVIAEAK